MEYKGRMFNPLNIFISDEKQVILGDDNGDDLPLNPGSVFGGVHYGFNIIRKKDNDYEVTSYPTECRIYGIAYDFHDKGEKLKVFEEGKYHYWIFSKKGDFERASSFFDLSRRDHFYVSEHFSDDPDFKSKKFFEPRKDLVDKKASVLLWHKIMLEQSSEEKDELLLELLKNQYNSYVMNEEVNYDDLFESLKSRGKKS